MNLKDIKHLIKTQDNRITQDPIFVVEQKRRMYGFDSLYADDYVWLDDDDYEEADKEAVAVLEQSYYDDRGKYNGQDYSKVYYKEHWEFVTACFTEQGCKDYINRDAHNLGETRIYAYSAYKNSEWRSLRKMLLDENEV